jgi:hypothetical protein
LNRTDDDEGLGAEVNTRLDEMFGDEEDEEFDEKDSPVSDLKAMVAGIDWEISDESMGAFLNEVNSLQKRYQDDKNLSAFLKLQEAIGKYIKAKKAKAHPDAIRFVVDVFKNFETVLTRPDMSETEKRRLVSSDIQKFKEFKQRVLSKGVTGEQKNQTAVSPGRPAAVLENQEALDYIVEELKKTIKSELQIIQQIIKNLGA